MYVLQLHCSKHAAMQLLDVDDCVCGTSSVEMLELCFAKQQHMNAWRSALAAVPIIHADGSTDTHNIQVLPIATIEAVVLNTKDPSIGNMGLKNNLSGKFSIREFYFQEGSLYWKRAKPDGHPHLHKGAAVQRVRQMFIANSTSCFLRSVRVQYDSAEEANGFQYQISVQTMLEENGEVVVENTTIGMGSEEVCMKWLNAFRDVVSVSPRAGHVYIPGLEDVRQAVTHEQRIASGGTADDGVGVGYLPNLGEHVTQGWLFKRSEASNKGEAAAATAPAVTPNEDDPNAGLRMDKYRRRWFVLVDFRLSYFKSPSEASKQDLALGIIDLRSAIEVREAADHGAPVNSIEIICGNGKNYVLVGEDEDEALRWLDALSDTLESRTMLVGRITANINLMLYRFTCCCVRAASNAHEVIDEKEIAKRIMKKRQSIVLEGDLSMKSVNRLTSVVTWKNRYFVIANGKNHHGMAIFACSATFNISWPACRSHSVLR
jgi:hypothetical protein